MPKIVDLRADVPTVAVRPTKANPEVRVVIGNDNGQYIPKQLIYPDSYSDDDVKTRVDRYMSESSADDYDCQVCHRYASEERNGKVLIAIGIVAVLAVGVALYFASTRGN